MNRNAEWHVTTFRMIFTIWDELPLLIAQLVNHRGSATTTVGLIINGNLLSNSVFVTGIKSWFCFGVNITIHKHQCVFFRNGLCYLSNIRYPSRAYVTVCTDCFLFVYIH